MLNERILEIAEAVLAERKRCEAIAKDVWQDAFLRDDISAQRAVSLVRQRIFTGAQT